VKQITSDDRKGLRKAITARFGGTSWQRCQFHLQQNAMSYVPRQKMRTQVAAVIREILHATDRKTADERLAQAVSRFEKSAPDLAE
jgi:putative transposase